MRRIILATLAALGLVLVAAQPVNAETRGFKWAETVDVYDATGGGSYKVAEAAAEWDATSGVTLRMTSDPAAANIVVRAVDWPCSTGNPGCAWYPPVTAGVASGVCNVEVASWLADDGVGEFVAIHELGHCLGLDHTTQRRSVMKVSTSRYDYFTKPQAFDRQEMRALYGR